MTLILLFLLCFYRKGSVWDHAHTGPKCQTKGPLRRSIMGGALAAHRLGLLDVLGLRCRARQGPSSGSASPGRHPPASVRGAGTGGGTHPHRCGVQGQEDAGSQGQRPREAQETELPGLTGACPPGRPAHLWFASFSESKPPGAGWSGRQAGAHSGPGRHSPDGSRAGALSGDFSQNEILLSGCLAWVLLLFIPSLQRKCEAAKSIPVEMLSDQLGFPDTPGPGGRVCVRVHVRVRVCV